MKVVFLDIDGVLNTERYLRIQAQKSGNKDQANMQYRVYNGDIQEHY